MSVQVAIAETIEGEGHILPVIISYRKDGDGSLWLNNIKEVTDANRASVLIAKRAAEWLAGKSFTLDVVIELLEGRKDVTGRSWELILTLGLTSLLTGIKIQEGTTGTGRIGEDGIVLSVIAYPEKIWSACQSGYKKFLVPHESLDQRRVLGQLQVIPVPTIQEAWRVATTGIVPTFQHRPENWASVLGFTI